MKQIREMLMSSEYTLKERLFLLGGIIGTFAMIAASILASLSGENFLAAIAPFIGTGIVAGVTLYSFTHKKIALGSSVVVFVSTVILIPYGYMKGGGIHSGSGIWFMVGIIVVFLFFSGKLFITFYLISVGSFAATVYLNYIHPEYVTPLGSEVAVFIDVFLSAVLVATIAGLMLHYQSVILERELKLSEEQHKEIEQLNEAQNKFFSSMSHEIRTPINTIIGLNEMNLREKNLSEEATENSLNIQNASRMLLSLINDILDVSKIQSGRMELNESQYETSRILSEIVNLLWNRAKEKGLQFNIHVGENIPSMLYGDEMRIKQVIINLLTNAIKYTQEGSVTLTVDGEKTNANTFMLQVTVADTGQGIRKENISTIFDTFKRLEGTENKTIEGTGLGLTITKQLVDLMKGNITVDSIYTKGSTFTVMIPQNIVSEIPLNFKSISDVHHELTEYQQTFEAPDAHVLIVDDNDMNRMVCRKLLRDTMVQIDLAESGKECLEKTMITHYDVIFMDHEMPEMDGIETVNRIRNQAGGLCQETPIVALTANAGSDRNAFYMEHGFQAYLAKPIHGSLLEATLLQLLPIELIEKAKVSKDEDNIVQVLQSQRKKDIIISTESVCGLNNKEIQQYDINIIPFYIVTGEGRFKDNSEMDAGNLQNYMLERNTNVTTDPSSVEEYEAFFGDLLAKADTVIHFAAAGKTSKSYKNAVTAAESFNNVRIVDTEQLSSGLGLLLIHAAKMVQQGSSADEIIEEMERYREYVKLSILVPSIDVVVRRQKTSLLTRLFVNVLNFEPSFTLKKGRIVLQRFYMGYLNNATIEYISSNFSRKKNIDTSKLYVVYSGYNDEDRQEIKKLINGCIRFDEIVFHKASATLTANIGMRYLGLAYVKKQ